MKQTIRVRMLGIYNLFLATGAIWIGIQMVMLSNGTIFAEAYPENWAERLPFNSWVMPGVLALVIFGLGNILAAYLVLETGITVHGLHLLLWVLFSFSA